MHVLITRPRHQTEATAAALAELGHTCSIEPPLEIRELQTAFPNGSFDGLILTSSNALPAMQNLIAQRKFDPLPVLTTGKASAEAAEQFGFKQVDYVVGSALDLVKQLPEWMAQHGLNGPLVYPCAESTAHDLGALLSAKDISCTHWPVYCSSPTSQFTETTKKALKAKKFDGVLLYSKRTAHTFVQLMQQDDISMVDLHVYLMSYDIFNALPKELQANAHYPDKPTEAGLLNLIGL